MCMLIMLLFALGIQCFMYHQFGLYFRLNASYTCLFSGSSDPQVPPGQGCPTPGCSGVGHIKGPRYGTHYTLVIDFDAL